MEKTLDKKGRWRGLTVAFRMSPEENKDLNTRVRLSGLTKQDYLTLYQSILETHGLTHLVGGRQEKQQSVDIR